jgi:aryl-alcohol dehydrogenase-like predicted oxidoreductase
MTQTQDTLRLGSTNIHIAPLGVGTWAWGDRAVWNYGATHNTDDVTAAFWASLNAGITLFDTAELYGRGISERLVGALARSSQERIVIATKFFPYPWRLSASTLHRALEGSLKRLQVEAIDLYQIHFPTPLISNTKLMDALADAVQAGKVRAVGVSNYSAEQMRRAHDALAKRDVPLASNQVEYSLLARKPETNGVLDACRELDVTLIAYSPLAMGLLGGKYTPSNRPVGTRRYTPRFSQRNLAAVKPVIALLRDIGTAHGGKTPAQVALNWLIQQGTLPIPGAKNLRQAQDNAAAIGWSLSSEEVQAMSDATAAWRS